jgi:hypothetical protein
MASPANTLQLKILKHLRANGVMIWKNQFNTYNHQLGIHTNDPYSPVGSSDLLGILPGGIMCCIEIKAGKDRMSPGQILFKKRIERLGGVYIIARSVEDVEHLIT